MIKIQINAKNGSPSIALIDSEDFDLVSQYNWYTSRKAHKGHCWYYLKASTNKSILMHRLVMGAQKGQIIDHINGNTFDNRKENLRFCTRSQNMCNRAKPRTKNKYKGVQAKRGKFRSRIYRDGTPYLLGTFVDEIEAAKAYDAAAIRLHGEFALLNFPHEKNLTESGLTSTYKFLDTSCGDLK